LLRQNAHVDRFADFALQRPGTVERRRDQHSLAKQLAIANSDFVPLKQTAPSRQKSFLIQGVGAPATNLSGASFARHGAQAAKIA
jgi:hypothetical protein